MSLAFASVARTAKRLRALALAWTALLCGPVAQAQTFDIWGVLRPEAPVTSLSGDGPAGEVRCPEPPATEVAAASPPSVLSPSAPLVLTGLTQAVGIALCQSPQTRLSWAGVRAQAAQIGQARASLLPTLTGGLSRSHDAIDSRNAANDDWNHTRVQSSGYNLLFNWLLFDFGTRAATITQAERSYAAALAGHDATLQAVALGAVQAWYDALAAAASVRAAEAAEATAAVTLKAAEARERAGAITPVEVAQARTAAAQALLARVRASGNAVLARGGLARALGIDVRTAIALPTQDDAALEAATAAADTTEVHDIGTAIGEALASHPSITAARAQVDAAEARLTALRAEGFPTFSVSYGSYYNGRPGTSVTGSPTYERVLSFTMSVPLFEGLNRNYREHEQRATISARRADLSATEAQVGFDAWRAFQSVEAERAGLVASVALVKSAAESLTAARARQRSGAIDLVEVLNAQRDDANARQERIQALSNWRTARLRLLANLGRLGFWAFEDGASLNEKGVRRLP